MSADSDEIVDLAFALSGHAVAEDYADLLWLALGRVLPWLETEPVGVHPLARISPGQEGQHYLSNHSRLTLRLSAGKVEAARALCGASLDLPEPVRVGEARVRPLVPAQVVYSPLVAVGAADEAGFLAECRRQLAALGIEAHQPIVGKAHGIQLMARQVTGFSLMLHGLDEDNSLRVQRAGIGTEHHLGCGLFVQHKSIAQLSSRY